MKQTTRDQVPITKQASLNFICPPVEEQREIGRRVEELFAYVDRIESRRISVRAQVERIALALLTRAFRGELVPQDLGDKQAAALQVNMESEQWAGRARREEHGADDDGIRRKKGATKSVASVE
jgi:type I restriction enzyme S subunit